MTNPSVCRVGFCLVCDVTAVTLPVDFHHRSPANTNRLGKCTRCKASCPFWVKKRTLVLARKQNGPAIVNRWLSRRTGSACRVPLLQKLDHLGDGKWRRLPPGSRCPAPVD